MPEQNPGTATTYSYNADDTILSVTDARGATATYSYNNPRHLVSGISYSAPGGITPTSNVTFAYDAAGNRILRKKKRGQACDIAIFPVDANVEPTKLEGLQF